MVRDVNVRVRVREGSSVEIQWKHKSGRGLVTIKNETEKVEEGDEDESNGIGTMRNNQARGEEGKLSHMTHT